MMGHTTRRRDRTQNPLRRRWAAIVLVALLAAALPVAQAVRSAPEADALTSFDTALLDHINEHRSSLGLAQFSEYAPLSDASIAWSRVMRNDSPFCGPGAGFRHDTLANIGSQGVPPGTTSAAENIAWSCGYPGSAFATDWSYNRMPADCIGNLDFTTALIQFCQWIDSTPHRQAIENAAYTWIGLGSVQRSSGAQTETFTTGRFATAPGGGVEGGYANGLCDGKIITIDMNTNGGNGTGTPNDDVILGTTEADRIHGLGGNDTICAQDGNDNVWGGTGNDIIFGGPGVDRIRGDGGADTINGDADRDIILGGDGPDTINGGSGRDSLYGGNDPDVIDGGPDTDLIRGEAANDRLFSGSSGNDRLVGGPGHDVIDARATSGSTRLLGDAGNDVFYGSNQLDRMWGGLGNDTMYGNIYSDLLRGGDDDDRIYGGFGRDTIDGGPGNDRLFGNEGDGDKLVGVDGTDHCDGGPGSGDIAHRTCETSTGIP